MSHTPGARPARPSILALLAAIVLSLTAAACGSDGGGEATTSDARTDDGTRTEATSLTVGLPGRVVIQFHPYYVAQELGYFDEEDLDVTIEVVDGGSAVVQQLIAGNIDVGIPPAPAYAPGLAQGHDLPWIYTYFHQNVFNLVTPESTGITSIEDLEGRTIGVSDLGGGEVPQIRGILGSIGLTEGQDYQLLPVGDGTALTYEALTDGQVDAYISSAFDVATVAAAGLPLVQLIPDEFRYFPSMGHVVTRQTLDEDGDALARFGRAVAKATAFSRENPDAARALTESHGPEFFEDTDLADAYWDAAVQLSTPIDELADAPFGTHHREGWERYLGFLGEGTEEEGAIPEGTIDLDRILDSTLLDQVNDFDLEAVRAAARDHETDG